MINITIFNYKYCQTTAIIKELPLTIQIEIYGYTGSNNSSLYNNLQICSIIHLHFFCIFDSTHTCWYAPYCLFSFC